ncbi:DUF881 domain-containing protein [Nocardioides sp.]|uniref:DUF881 domain-containing protein n=1 Tax=Nocardioides sp. TaxID=35761 RepID=UPI003D0AD3DE
MPEPEPADQETTGGDATSEAEARAEVQPASPGRLWSALTKPSRAQFVVAVLLAALGFAAVTQVRTNGQDDTYAGRREQDLIDLLNGLAGASERSQSEITRLERARSDLLSTTRRREAALEQARTEADTLNILAGLVPVTGPGIRITIEDPDDNVGIDILLDTVQELRTAGAEAMSFNGTVRVVADTAFENGVGGVIVDGQQLSPPYVIDVIGEPNALSGAITFRQGPEADVEEGGGTVTIKTFDSLDIKAVTEPVRSEFAQPSTS